MNMKSRAYIYDIKTGKGEWLEVDIPPASLPSPSFGINFEKLIKVLIAKRIISTPEELI